MIPGWNEFVALDLAPLLTAVFASISCALIGNFLVLRKLSLMGDAISHAVLPGLVIGFIVTQSRATLPMFVGAAAAGVITVVLIEAVRRFGRVEPGAAMGVVFSILFALGVVLLEAGGLHSVDLDASCVLHGQLETAVWTVPPSSLGDVFGTGDSTVLPRQLVTTGVVLVLSMGFVLLLYKELRLSAFDGALATSLGFSDRLLSSLLMGAVAMVVVASFEAVGSILVIAMLICPPATARLLTDRYGVQLVLSCVIAIVVTLIAYPLAAWVPPAVGMRGSLSASGMMTVVSGAVLVGAAMLSPSHGVIARRVRHRRLALDVVHEDLIAMLWRVEEAHELAGERHLEHSMTRAQIGEALGTGLARAAIGRAQQVGNAVVSSGRVSLTDAGRAAAKSLVRTHRLWEHYLVHELGLRADHVHRTAMDLEHVTSKQIERELREQVDTDVDPHGKPIW